MTYHSHKLYAYMQNYAYARTHVGKGTKKIQKANGFTNQIKKYLKLFEWAKIENADLEYNYNAFGYP